MVRNTLEYMNTPTEGSVIGYWLLHMAFVGKCDLLGVSADLLVGRVER